MSEKMTPKRVRTPDFGKMQAILTVLKEFPDGIWLRELSKRAKMPYSTVCFYVDGVLRDFLDNVGYKNEDDKYIGLRIIKLKPAFLSRNINTDSIKRMMEAQKLLKSVGK